MTQQGPIAGNLVQEALPGVGLQMQAQVTTNAGSPTKLVAARPSSNLAHQSTTVQAASTNSASVWLGGSDVSSAKGYELQPGQSISLPLEDPSTLYAWSAAAQKINVGWV